ncbi:major facilitator transporter [Caballeronia hypogeia]|uniref:Major facilitator transporter n=2 Tax=Caballeronia hypogeia TaxID=1777140 RepID=A0A158D974_9BURK|nr:major facilitator transporter [Caballeronia hypogeia]
MDGYILSVVGVALTQVSRALNLDSFTEGMVAAAALLGIFFGGFIGGGLTDRFGRKKLFLVSPMIFLACSIGQYWVESGTMLFILRFLIGVGVGMEYPVASAMLVEFLPSRYRGPRLCVVQILWFGGAALAYLFGNLILDNFGHDSWRLVLASSAVLSACVLIARIGTPESPRWLLSKGRGAEADRILESIYGYPVALPGTVTPSHGKKPASFIKLLRSGYGLRMIFIVVFWTCAVVPVFAVYAFVPKVLDAFNLEGQWASFGSTIITSLFVVGCIVATWLINRMGRRKMLIHSFLWSGLALFLLSIAQHDNSVLILALFGAYAVFIGGAQVLQTIYPNELFPTEVRAAAMGMGTSLSRVGAAAGTWLVPMSLESIGIAHTMLAAAIVTFIGLLATVFMAPETGNMSLERAASLER